MSERITDQEALALASALESVKLYLDNEGRIDYDKLDPERVEHMRQEVGAVEAPVFQDPIHQETHSVVDEAGTVEERASLTQFMHEQNNFYNCFYPQNYMGKLYRKLAAVRRFELLFPEFDQALCAMTPRYARARVEGHNVGSMIFSEDDVYANSLRTAYGIMSQLVDANDSSTGREGGTKVHELDEDQRIRRLSK